MSRKLPSHNKSPPSKRSLDSTTISEFSSSVRSDHVPSRPLSPAQKRFNSSKDKREMKETDISLSNDLNGYQKNVAKLDMHSINGKIKSRKCVLQEKERIYPKLVDDKHDQENKVPRDYNEHSIFIVSANTGPELSSGSLESSTTANILKEETHSNIRQITVSEAPKEERTSTPISPKKEEDYFANKTGNVRTVLYDAETKKMDFVSLTEVENNVTHEGTKQEGNENGEISDMKDANQNLEETTSSHPVNTGKTDEAQENIKPPKTLRYAEISQRNTAFTDKRLIKNEKSDIVASTMVDATGQEQRETKSNSDGFAEISVTNTIEKERTPMNRYEDELWNSLSDAKEQQQENISFKERVIRDVDEIKEAKQETDATIEKNNGKDDGKDDEKSIEEEYNHRKHSQDNMSEKLIEDENHEVELLGAEDNIPSKHCANETSNWSRALNHEISISDTERNETVTEQHISSALREDSLSSLADPKLHSLALSNDNTDKTDSTDAEVNNRPSSEAEKVKVLTTVTSSVVDSSEDVYSEMSSSEDDASEGNVSDVTRGQTENIGNTRGGKPDENTPVEEPRTNNAENVTSIQPENEHVKSNVDDIPDKPMDDIIHEPETLVDDTNDRDITMETEHQNAVESVQFKHKIPEKCEKELRLEQKTELEPHSIRDSAETRKSSETEDQTADGELPKETGTDATVGVLQDADEESNINVKKLERQEWQEEKSEELVEEIAEERSLGLENGNVSDKDAVYSETQANMNLKDETVEPLRKEKETIKLNQESVLTVSTHAETDIEIKPHSIKDLGTRKSPETEDQPTETELPKETGIGVKVGMLQDADEESNIMNVNKLEKQEWHEEKSEELVEEIAEERSLGLENGNVSDKDAVYSETQAKIYLQDETDEPLTMEKETIKLNLELELAVSTQAETDIETKPRSIKDSETRKSPETEDQPTETELPKETGTGVKVGMLQDADEESNIMNVNKLEKQEWQEEKSEELVEEIAEERSLGLENGNVSDKDAVYSETQAKMNLQDETDEPLRKEKETIKLNQELVLTVSTHAETDAETKPMDSTNISSIGAERRIGTPESTVQDPDTNEGQYEKSKEIKEPSVSEHERTAVKETGEHNETQRLLDEENILAVKITEESPKVIESEMGRDRRSDNEIRECRQNDKESNAKPESLNFDHTISIPTKDTKAEGIEHSTTQDEMEKDHVKIGFQSEDQINARSSGISQIMVKEIDPNDEDRSSLGEPQNHQAVLKMLK